MKIQHQQLYVI